MAFPTPSWLTSPYIPERTYATASPTAIRIPNNFCAPFLRERESNHHLENKRNKPHKYVTVKEIEKATSVPKIYDTFKRQ